MKEGKREMLWIIWDSRSPSLTEKNKFYEVRNTFFEGICLMQMWQFEGAGGNNPLNHQQSLLHSTTLGIYE